MPLSADTVPLSGEWHTYRIGGATAVSRNSATLAPGVRRHRSCYGLAWRPVIPWCQGILLAMLDIRDNLPLAFLGIAFVALASAIQCTSTTGDPATNSEAEAGGGTGQIGTDDSGTPMGCSKDNDCPLPPSTCEGNSTLVYYTDARCVQHQCQWQSQRQQGAACSGGGFLGTTTSAGSVVITMPDGQAGANFNDEASADAASDHAIVASPDAGECADDGGGCDVPASVCADARWLAFFTNGSCQDNRCQWQVAYRDCGDLGCNVRGCVMNVTK